VARARLALDIVAGRLALTGAVFDEIRYDLIGIDAIHGRRLSATEHEPYEVRARVAARTGSLREAIRIGNEVEALYTNGPAGGGGVAKTAREVIAMYSTLMPRGAVRCVLHYDES